MAPATPSKETPAENGRGNKRKEMAVQVWYAALVAVVAMLVFSDRQTKTSPFSRLPLNSSTTELLAVVIFGLVGDIFVLGYHSTHPTHPKFHINSMRGISLFVHVFSGCAEVFVQCCAFFSPNPTPWSYLSCAIAFLGHIPTATVQAPHVFGIKVWTLPFYFCFICLHASTSYHLLLDPTNPLAILRQSVAIHGYAWVRIAIFLFQVTNTVRKHEYTAAIWFAGFLTVPPVWGVQANFYFFIAVGGFQLFLWLSKKLPPRFLHSILGFGPAGIDPLTIIEFSRKALAVLPDSLIVAAVEIDEILEKKENKASKCCLQDNKNSAATERQPMLLRKRNSLSQDRRDSLLHMLRASLTDPTLYINNENETDSMDDSSTSLSKTMSDNIRASLVVTQQLESAYQTRIQFLRESIQDAMKLMDEVFCRVYELDKQQRARLVFNMFKGNAENVDLIVLAAVLIYWTVPISDVENLIKKHCQDGKHVSLEEFTEHFEEVYEYVILSLQVERRMVYLFARDQNIGTERCPVHAIKDALMKPNVFFLEE